MSFVNYDIPIIPKFIEFVTSEGDVQIIPTGDIESVVIVDPKEVDNEYAVVRVTNVSRVYVNYINKKEYNRIASILVLPNQRVSESYIDSLSEEVDVEIAHSNIDEDVTNWYSKEL